MVNAETRLDDSVSARYAQGETRQGFSELHMTDGDWRQRIVCDPAIHHGEPCIRGTRIAVSVIVGSLADLCLEDLLREYPQLTREDVQSALLYAAEAAHSTLVA